MTSKPDKRRSPPRQSTAPSALPLPLPLPFPRPLGAPTHRRTQSSAPTLPSPDKRSSNSHRRSKSWLANLFKSPSTAPAEPTTTTTRRKEYQSGSLKFFNNTRHSTQRKDVTAVAKEPVHEFGNHEIMLTPSLPPPGVYEKPRRPLTMSQGEKEQEDLARRLASWDWDGGERSCDDDEDESFDTTLEIRPSSAEAGRVVEEEEVEGEAADESLGTVWKGFLEETVFEGAASHSRIPLSRALSPTSTSPPLPPIPCPAEPDQEESRGIIENEISFLSLAGDSSLANSTSMSHFNLSSFPSPSGGEISFTDPFRFAMHLSSPSRPATSPPTSRFRVENDRSPSGASTSNHSTKSTTTLAERRSKPVPSLRINSLVTSRKQSTTHSLISESVYSRYEEGEEEDRNERETEGDESKRGRGGIIESSYFSPISPEYPPLFSPSNLVPLPSPHRITTAIATPSPLATSTSSSSSSASSSSSDPHNSSRGRHSLLFERPIVEPPSSTFDHTERFVTPKESDDVNPEEERGGFEIETRKKKVRISGWREDWTFKVEEPDLQPEEEQDEEAEESDDASEGELEKRMSLHGQRELERRAIERKERWKEERNCLYGEPVDAEYEFGLAL
ncbi:hypothetical protein JCM16303_001616 [Sporobolomyces ruberrimus]